MIQYAFVSPREKNVRDRRARGKNREWHDPNVEEPQAQTFFGFVTFALPIDKDYAAIGVKGK